MGGARYSVHIVFSHVMVIDPCSVTILANAGKAGMAFVGFNSPASYAKYIGMQCITCMPAVFEDESKRELAAYMREEDDLL